MLAGSDSCNVYGHREHQDHPLLVRDDDGWSPVKMVTREKRSDQKYARACASHSIGTALGIYIAVRWNYTSSLPRNDCATSGAPTIGRAMSTPTTAKKTQTKAAFVRALPHTMPAKDVVAKASEAKIKLDADYVYKVRSTANDKKSKSSRKSKAKTVTVAMKATAPAASTSKVSKVRGRKPTKKTHVLALQAQNPTWTADQIAKAANASTALVYAVWKKRPKGAKTSPAKKVHARSSSASTHGESTTEFYRVLKRVGVERAKQLIANIEEFQNA